MKTVTGDQLNHTNRIIEDLQLCNSLDIAEPVALLRHNFPMLDEEILHEHFMQANYDLEEAVYTLSSLEAGAVAIDLEPADVPSEKQERRKAGQLKTILGNVIALTDHPKQPLYCFIVLVSRSDSLKYKAGKLVRPVPRTCVSRDDEMGRFWVKRTSVPEFGSMVELNFFEEDTREYVSSAQGNYPQQNEDLLCASLELKGGCHLMKDLTARQNLIALACNDVTTKWPWGSGLQKFASVTPGKFIWHVPAEKKHLSSVVLLRVKRDNNVEFVYRNAASKKISCNFSAGGKRLTDIPITAAGYNEYSPHELNMRYASREHVDQIFVLGLARAEKRGPEGFNRLVECSDKLKSLLNEDDFEDYCQILLIGTIDLTQEP